MSRCISFALTTQQFLDGTKDVTRRHGWGWLQAGTVLTAVRQVRGLKRGQKVERLGDIRVKSVRREPLNAITQDDVAREGFPKWTPAQFVNFFCHSHRKCAPDCLVTRIEFERVR